MKQTLSRRISWPISLISRACSIKITVTSIKELAQRALESGMRCSAPLSLEVTAASGYRTTPALAVIWQQPASRICIFPVRIAALALSLGNFAIGTAELIGAALAQEFILGKFTKRGGRMQ